MNQLPETPSDRHAKQRSFTLLCTIACAVRLVYSASVFLKSSGTAAWIEAGLGALLVLPATVLFYFSIRMRDGIPCKRSPALICILFFPFFTFDASAWIYTLSECSSYTTFTDTDVIFLYLPAFLCALLIVSRGAYACGGLARGTLFTAGILLSLALLCQISQMHPIWLMPILGGGAEAILGGSIFCAGTAALYPAGIWLFAQTDPAGVARKVQAGFLRGLLWAALAAVLFLLLYGMLAPNIPDAPHIRSFNMERLLTGGGRGTSVHFPSLIGWYLLLLLTSVFSLFCASCCLRLAFPARSARFCSIVSAIFCIPWTPLRMFWRKGEDWMVFLSLIIVSAISAYIWICALIAKRRKKQNDSQ